MFSETGKQSIKRVISGLFAITVVYMIWYLTHNIVPKENEDLFRNCFEWLCGMIAILTGAAMIKDIVALRTGKKETLEVNTPDKSITQTTETPTPTNQ
jgi:hypothetical protein